MLAGCQGSRCAAGMDCGGTQRGQTRVFPAPKWSPVVGAQHRTLAPHSQDQADVLCPLSQKKGAHSDASTCTPWAEWCQGKETQQEAVGGKGGKCRQPWLMGVPWGHHSTAQPRISSEKQK